jgi:hypothetical protein
VNVRELIYALRNIPDEAVVVLNNDILGSYYIVDHVNYDGFQNDTLIISVGDEIHDGST